MADFADWISINPLLAVSMGAFACGVALFYLVMRRTQKHRMKLAERNGQPTDIS